MLLWSLGGMAATLFLLALAFHVGTRGRLGWIAVVSVAAYVGFAAIGLGPVFWLLIAEIFPLALRGRAMSLSTLAVWGFNLIVSATFLDLVVAIGGAGTFVVYAVLSLVALVFVLLIVPETKRLSLEQIEEAIEAGVDWQRLAGLTGFSTHVIVVNRSCGNLSHEFGDNVSPVQEIYGAGGSVLVHLVSAYAERTAYAGRLDVVGGRMNVENDFASSPLYCNFTNTALCGDPKALPGGDIGHSAFPDAVWGGRLRVRPTPDSYIEAGV
jgi:MFS family permease